jgi:ABC-type ATPase with predicted acetyltransferase domain
MKKLKIVRYCDGCGYEEEGNIFSKKICSECGSDNVNLLEIEE